MFKKCKYYEEKPGVGVLDKSAKNQRKSTFAVLKLWFIIIQRTCERK